MSGSTEQQIARHYKHGDLERSILDALAAAGKDLDRLLPADLSPVDEFHIGGRQATMDLAAQMDIKPGLHFLDIGSGPGGASRYFADEFGCRVTGIDLTEEYVRVAEALARRVKLDGQVSYRQASALALPFAPASFDGAYMLHVGMNIEDKGLLFREARRVLRPGSVFAVYDVMRENDGPLLYPVPWATSEETSFVETVATYRRLLEAAGFKVQAERSRRSFAIDHFRQVRARWAESDGPPPLGSHILMGAAAPQRIGNMTENLQRGLVAPTEIVCRAV